ncbi:hypothetical protein [Sulfitobacter geojensis]|uniref:hypothetical protein n=1 Tax=Sulfitobacter geojensis TaxID=1342299 RepID=UPI003B8AEF2B
MNTYTSENVDSFELAEANDGKLVFSVMPLMETAYYLAGAKLSQTDDAVEVRLVRCGLNETCEVDVLATVAQGSNEPYKIEMPMTDKSIVVVYGDDVRRAVYP